MKKFIGILEDDREGRIPAFQRAAASLAERGLDLVIRESAPEFLAWLQERWGDIALVSLDHDLGNPCERDGKLFLPGDGMAVVKYLRHRPPMFPVIVHSSNPVAAERMMLDLVDGEWNAWRLPPFGDDWIGTAWARRVLILLEA